MIVVPFDVHLNGMIPIPFVTIAIPFVVHLNETIVVPFVTIVVSL
jgi:hypothetical protein